MSYLTDFSGVWISAWVFPAALTTLELARLVCVEKQKMRFQKQQYLVQIAQAKCFLIQFA